MRRRGAEVWWLRYHAGHVAVTEKPVPSPRPKPPAFVNVLLLVVVVAILLVFTEVFLRYQPFVALYYPEEGLDPDTRLSMLYHHKWRGLSDPQRATVGACDSPTARHVKLLFLGDSWMQPTDGIPRGFAESLVATSAVPRACYEITNGGTRSYAPSLMLVKGRKLIAEDRPDFMVVYVDETDVMDETVRYARTTLRGTNGEIERVVPGIADLLQAYERPILVQQRWYTLRLLEQLYYDQVLMPRVMNVLYGSPDPIEYPRIMAMQLSKDPDKDFAAELAYFRGIVREMLKTFVDRVGAERVLVVRHPHYLHLSINGAPPRYNEAMTKILAEETAPLGITYYDAELHLGEIYDGDPTHYMQWPSDPYSHLTDEGFRVFGRGLGRAAEAQLSRVVANAEDPRAPAPAAAGAAAAR